MDGIADPIALSGNRELEIIPWHFTVVTLRNRTDPRRAREWIWKNLTGRFSSNVPHYTFYRRNINGDLSSTQIGFEDPLEASAFILTEPLLEINDDF